VSFLESDTPDLNLSIELAMPYHFERRAPSIDLGGFFYVEKFPLVVGCLELPIVIQARPV
jgi:hypothetical protein